MPVFVTDFDGTITLHDFYRLVIDECRPPCGTRHWDRHAAGEISHFEALNLTFAEAPVGRARLEELADRMDPDPNLADGLRSLREAGWRTEIVSAGCRWYIDRVLAKAGAVGLAEIHANDGDVEHGRLVMRLPSGSPYFCPDVGIDKPAVIRRAVASGNVVVFAGNGPPDLAPALLVPPDRRHARADLAEALAARGEGFRPFHRWNEVVRSLVASPSSLGDARP